MSGLCQLFWTSTAVQAIERMLQGYTEGRVIFDRYISNPLKSQTRAKLNVNIESVKFNIYDKTNIKMVPLKTSLSHRNQITVNGVSRQRPLAKI